MAPAAYMPRMKSTSGMATLSERLVGAMPALITIASGSARLTALVRDLQQGRVAGRIGRLSRPTRGPGWARSRSGRRAPVPCSGWRRRTEIGEVLQVVGRADAGEPAAGPGRLVVDARDQVEPVLLPPGWMMRSGRSQSNWFLPAPSMSRQPKICLTQVKPASCRSASGRGRRSPRATTGTPACRTPANSCAPRSARCAIVPPLPARRRGRRGSRCSPARASRLLRAAGSRSAWQSATGTSVDCRRDRCCRRASVGTTRRLELHDLTVGGGRVTATWGPARSAGDRVAKDRPHTANPADADAAIQHDQIRTIQSKRHSIVLRPVRPDLAHGTFSFSSSGYWLWKLS